MIKISLDTDLSEERVDLLNAKKDAEIREIEEYIGELRAKRNRKPTSDIKQELSCELYGEAYNLVERQLVTTINGQGCWSELEDTEIRELVLDYIRKEKEYNSR